MKTTTTKLKQAAAPDAAAIERAGINGQWRTIATVGHTGTVGRDENRAAHGAVCQLQSRQLATGAVIGRKVNTNGRHAEFGEFFGLSADQLANWLQIAAAEK